MEYSIDDVRNAYNKLRTYVFYDNSNLLLREQIAEFETGITKDDCFEINIEPYITSSVFNHGISLSVEEKLKILTQKLNEHNSSLEAQDFFDYFLDRVKVDLYPKKFTDKKNQDSWVSNERIESEYKVGRVAAFINAPIELHILSVLWIIDQGVCLDAKLSNHCVGNRLLLNKDKTKVVSGSGLFKPYYKQYQIWRDSSVRSAKSLLDEKKDVLFVNLDIKNYFHSVRIQSTVLYDENNPQNKDNKVNKILLKLHIGYTKLIASRKYRSVCEFKDDLKRDEQGQLSEFILPIGLLSSYVLANNYLKEFDSEVLDTIRPSYYGRYVDDIIMVIPVHEIHKIKKGREAFLHNHLSSVFSFSEKKGFPIKFCQHNSLVCQGTKSLFYFFKHNESTIVIDKLKRELDERTSEFRDLPVGNSSNFEDCAYHLLYDGSEGKIKTLKDYKENRYGLTVYLANKIFASLRQTSKLSPEESAKILSLFKGQNCLDYFRLWEKILTLFIVNDRVDEYIQFYAHCVEQIGNIKVKNKSASVNTKATMLRYLDCAHELTFALNHKFFCKHGDAQRFEAQLNKLDPVWAFVNVRPTYPTAPWYTRFNDCNLIRHHYVIHPLLNYTNATAKQKGCLITPSYSFNRSVDFPAELFSCSPRPVMFWECCIATRYKKEFVHLLRKAPDDYLNSVWGMYAKLNKSHSSSYAFNDNDPDRFYKTKKNTSSIVSLTELFISGGHSLSKPRIAFGNTLVDERNVESGIQGKPNLSGRRYNDLVTMLNRAREERADILLLPEFFISFVQLPLLAICAAKNNMVIVTGIEHVIVNGKAYNFIVTIIPVEVNGAKDAIVLFRLKNHYAPHEELLLTGHQLKIPKPSAQRYDLVVWRNIYFSTYYCFELADIIHRSLFKSKIDLLIAIEWNKDVNYFSNIVESCARDLHVYVAQANTCQYGDSRLTQPTEHARQDLLRLKGGINDAILVAEIDVDKLRDFQRKTYHLTSHTKEFKPLPPDHNYDDVLKRIGNKPIF